MVVDAAAVEANGLWLHEAPLALALLLVVVFASGRMVALREDRVGELDRLPRRLAASGAR